MTAASLFDTALLAHRRRRAAAAPADFLLRRVAGDLAERLEVVLRDFPVTVEIGSLGSHVAEALAPRPIIRFGPSLARPDVVADDNALPLGPASADLIVSALALHWLDDLPGALVQIRRALRPDGLFLGAILGGSTLIELRQAFTAAESEIEGGVSPRVAPFVEVRDAGSLLQRAGFALPVVDADMLTVRYDHAIALMADLRAMGATNIMAERLRRPTRRATFARLAEIYAERFSDPDGRIRASFEVLWLSGWAPHDSQQKPLRPGSAKQRLADALGVPEQSAGDSTPARR